MSDTSCIVGQMTHLGKLTEKESALLNELERNPKFYEPNERICEAGSMPRNFFTLRSGWACATRSLADGQRQVLDIFLPGQIMGLREIVYQRSVSDLSALTEVEACPFPRQRLTELFNQAPRLAHLFLLVMAQEQALLTERIINVGRRPAAERLAHFILEIMVRTRSDSGTFELPMTQSQIGDALGLSAVHVSRTLKQLRDSGMVVFEHQQVEILDLDALVELAHFDRDYLDCGKGWSWQS